MSVQFAGEENVSIGTLFEKLFPASGHLAKGISTVSQQRTERPGSIEGFAHNRERLEQVRGVPRDSGAKLFAQSSMPTDDRHSGAERSAENRDSER